MVKNIAVRKKRSFLDVRISSFYNLSLGALLFYTFFFQLFEKYKSIDNILFLFPLGLFFFCCFCEMKNIKIKFIRETAGWSAILFIGIIHNYGLFQFDIIDLKIFIFIVLIFLLLSNTNWINSVINFTAIYSAVHAGATMLFFLNINLYYKYIKPIYSDIANASGYKSALARHYSTNGMYLALGVITVFCLCLKNKFAKKYILLLLLLVFALLLTTKRAHLLFSIMSICMIYFCYHPVKRAKYILILLSASALMILILILLSAYIPEVLQTYNRFINLSNGDITNGRIPLYKMALEMFLKKPVFGNGWGSFRPTAGENGLGLLNTHNVYLQLLAEVGIVGFLIFIITAGSTFLLTYKLLVKSRKRIFTLNQNYEYYLCFSLGIQSFFLLYCITGNPLYDIQIFFLYSLACAGAYAIRFSARGIKQKWTRILRKLEL